MGSDSLVSQPSIGIWKAKTMAIAIQYCTVAKIPVRSQASSSTTTPRTAPRVMIVYSGTAGLPGRLAPCADHGAHRFVCQQTANGDDNEESQLLQWQSERQLDTGDEAGVVGPVVAVDAHEIPDREDDHHRQHGECERSRPAINPGAR